MVFNDTFNNISVVVSFTVGGNQSTLGKPPTCHKSLTNVSHNVVVHLPMSGIRTHNCLDK